ncbi:MAG: outer membrane lipoprotein carrier protein LolA [Rubrivivax sp.]|nr:outer membrane lipoprotein carrier protein LolA [Rubrivivax sp.]
MKTPNPDRRRLLVRTLALAAAGPLAARAQAARFDLKALTALLAQRREAEARFSEERHVTGFDSPLRASGTLSFSAPDRFVRHVLEPRPESMAVQGNTIVLRRGGRSRQMTLDAVPELTALVEAMRGTLTGDAALLQRHFETRVEGEPGRWTLTLLPRDARLATQVREMQIAGQAGEIRSVGLWLTNGDRSLMLVDNLPPGTLAREAR